MNMTQTTATPDVRTRNEVYFVGRLGRDPEMSYTKNGKAVTKFSLAVDQGRDKDAMWLNIVCWEHLAERAYKEAAKGDEVTVIGRLTQRKWDGKYYHDVVAESVEVNEKRGRKAEDDEENDLEETKPPF
jgi:single-strand DNA-binding protein